MIPTVILVGADKGGVGKTTTSRALLDYLDAHRVKVRAFDSQPGDGALIRFAASAVLVDLGRVEDQMRIFDGIAEDTVTVVDVCAGALSPTIKALDDAQLLADVRAGNMRLVLLHVLGPTFASIAEVAAINRRLGGSARHLLIKNYINSDQFADWDVNPTARESLAKMSDVTVTIEQLAPKACTALEKIGGTFVAFAEQNPSRILRGLVRTWLDKVWGEFDRVNVLGSDKQGARGNA